VRRHKLTPLGMLVALAFGAVTGIIAVALALNLYPTFSEIMAAVMVAGALFGVWLILAGLADGRRRLSERSFARGPESTAGNAVWTGSGRDEAVKKP
jgi:hypothetical protein